MGGLGKESGLQEKPAILKDEDIFLKKTSTPKIRLKVVPYSSLRKKTVTTTSPLENSWRDVPDNKDGRVEYPGRSVLYSRQFRPLNRIQNAEDNEPPVG